MISKTVIRSSALAVGILVVSLRPAVAADRPVSDLDAVAGKKIYIRECAACHGDKGNGKGPAANFLDPRPRDFTRKAFKFRTTPAGKPPATEDIARVVEHGVPGTAMPPFGYLTADERKKVVAHVLVLADLLDTPEPDKLPDPGPRPPTSPESLAKGKQIYTAMGCVKCHGESGRGDGVAAADLTDEEDRPIKVRDFTTGVYRGGGSPQDLLNRFVSGMDGTPMPSFGDMIQPADRWALIDFVLSLQKPASEPPLPADPLAAGRAITDKYGCRGCHILDDGKGGETGPDLRISGRKLLPKWTREFLKDPRAPGKIYPWRPARMPGIKLSDAEVEALVKYLSAAGQRPAGVPDEGPAVKLAEKPSDEGKNMFVLRCSQCHALGDIVKTPLAAQQGPDLINASKRVDFEWAKTWISDPRKLDPKTKMTVTDITPPQIEAVRDFVWRMSLESRAGGTGGGR